MTGHPAEVFDDPVRLLAIGFALLWIAVAMTLIGWGGKD